ncbi:RNHCP domain-containing protein [Streptomyces anulatus]|uniref:RNHCP domain-containing protein n=1 Tax=Streptomyces anulatus TaxID=1892 RepID=UPI00344A2C17
MPVVPALAARSRPCRGRHQRMPGAVSPISVAELRTGDWMVLHRCVRCDKLTFSPICADDNQLILMRMAVSPLAQPPFPLEAFGDL